MLGSSRPEVICQKGALKISQNSQGITYARVSFLRKLQDACEFSKIFGGKCSLFNDFIRKENILKATTTVNKKETYVHP